MRSISFLNLASLLYAAIYFNGIETKTGPRNSFKVVFVSSQLQKGNLLKKYHYQVGAFNKTLDQKPDYLEVHFHLSTYHNKLGKNIKADQHLKI